VKGLISAIIYLEKQGNEAALGQAVETVIELIREEQPERGGGGEAVERRIWPLLIRAISAAFQKNCRTIIGRPKKLEK
jgi:hypothetical protein